MKPIEQKILDSITPDSEPEYKNIFSLMEFSPDTSQEFCDSAIDKLKQYGFWDNYNDYVLKYKAEHDEIYRNASRKMQKDLDEVIKKNQRIAQEISREKEETPEHRHIEVISAVDLVQMDIAPIEFLVRDILPKGLGIVSAPPKYYKSFLMLQTCLSVCMNKKLLKRGTTQATCIYFDLESSKRRPRDRILKMLGDEKPPGNLYIITAESNVGTLQSGFMEVLAEQVHSHDNVGLIVIDVFQKIRTSQKRAQSLYDYDYQDLNELKRFSDEYNLSILLVHHNRKMKDSQDVYNNMSGSTGLLGAVDFCWVIEKERTSNDAVLHITGRDIEPVELSIRFNNKSFLWEYIGTQEEVAEQKRLDEYNSSNIITTIKKLVQINNGEYSGSATDIVKASRHLGNEIYDNEKQVGKIINEYRDLLKVVDRISFTYKKDKSRQYIFTCP